jgi:hypothetical protein
MLRRKNVVEGSISVVVTTIVVEPHEGVECGVCSVHCTLHGRRIADEAADRTEVTGVCSWKLGCPS